MAVTLFDFLQCVSEVAHRCRGNCRDIGGSALTDLQAITLSNAHRVFQSDRYAAATFDL